MVKHNWIGWWLDFALASTAVNAIFPKYTFSFSTLKFSTLNIFNGHGLPRDKFKTVGSKLNLLK